MKEHPKFRGYYGSEDGEIYSNKRKNFSYYKLKPQKHKLGYLLYFLSIDGKHMGVTGHRFIAECFIPNPNNYSDVHHLDFNKRNNSVFNLKWTTHKENCSYNDYIFGKYFYVENVKTGENCIIFNLSKWCKENKVSRANAYKVIAGQYKQTKNFIIKPANLNKKGD